MFRVYRAHNGGTAPHPTQEIGIYLPAVVLFYRQENNRVRVGVAQNNASYDIWLDPDEYEMFKTQLRSAKRLNAAYE